MKRQDKIRQAKEKIAKIKHLGIEIKKSAPHLNRIEKTLDLCDIYSNSGDQNKNDFLEFLTPTIDYVNSISLDNFSLNVATGTTASLVTSITDASLSSTPKIYTNYIKEFSTFMPQQSEINYILDKSKKIDPELQKQFANLIEYYNIWLNKIKSDSDYAKDLRNFMEHLKGYLNNTSDLKSFSWNKMIDKIGSSDSKIKVIFMKQQKVYEALYESLSQILKENITKVRLPIQDHHDNLIRMAYSIMTCIDSNKLKKK